MNVKIVERRILAGFVDTLLWLIIFIIAAHFFGTSQVINSGGDINYSTNLTGWPFLIFIICNLSYFVLLEELYGATLGKMLFGIKVVSENGSKITIKQSLYRNLLRIVDGFPYIIPNLVGLVVLSTNDKKQRIGDRVAKTLVVKK